MRLTILLLWFMIASGAAVIQFLLAWRIHHELRQRVMRFFFVATLCSALYNVSIAIVAYIAMQASQSRDAVSLSLVLLTLAQLVLTVPSIAFSAHILGLTNGGQPKLKEYPHES